MENPLIELAKQLEKFQMAGGPAPLGSGSRDNFLVATIMRQVAEGYLAEHGLLNMEAPTP